jgi:glycosyltransferase involved in cell wall biosynthesis
VKKVSVIVPCYNGGKTLVRAVDSIINQSYSENEIIVVNDGSNDERTLEVLKGLPDQVQVINQENKGLSAARNTGLKSAKGHYVLTLDSDDYLSPTFLEKAVDLIEKEQGLAYVFTHINMFGEKQGVLQRKYNYFVQLFNNQLPYCLLMQKELWEKVGGYDENMKLGYEDWEFNIRLGKNGYFGIELQEPLFNYYVSSSGMMKSTSDKHYISILRSIRKKHNDIYSINRLYSIWIEWKDKPMPYPAAMYFLMYIATEILPGNLYNYLYKKLEFMKQSERLSA